MNRKQVIEWTTLTLAVVLFATFCSRGPGETNAQVPEVIGKIGLTCVDLTNPFFKLISNVMTEEAAKYGYEIVSLDGNNDPAKQ